MNKHATCCDLQHRLRSRPAALEGIVAGVGCEGVNISLEYIRVVCCAGSRGWQAGVVCVAHMQKAFEGWLQLDAALYIYL